MCSYFFRTACRIMYQSMSMFVVHGVEWWFQTHASLECTVLIADDVVKSRIPVGTNFAKLFQNFHSTIEFNGENDPS